MDLILAMGTIAIMLWVVVYLGTGEANLITQAQYLLRNKSILLGIGIVVTVLLSVIFITNKAEAEPYRYEVEVGLDRPLVSNNIGCVIEGDQTASNINARVLFGEGILRYGVIYNHQSCAANEDWRTSDRIGLSVMMDYPLLRIETSAQTWLEGELRIPVTAYYKIYTLDQYQFVGFLQKQFGTYNEASYGLALNWRF